MAEEFRVLKPLEYHRHFFAENTRVDGRPLLSPRTIKCETDAIKTADASALVKVGNTSVICGCIVGIRKNISNDPKSSSNILANQNQTEFIYGPIDIKIVLPPICSNTAGFNGQLAMNNRPSTTTAYVMPSKQSESALLLTRLINQIFYDSECINFEQLNIENTDYHWTINLEIICLNYDGSLVDCALISAIEALKSLKFPQYKINPDDNIPKRIDLSPLHPKNRISTDYDQSTSKLEFKSLPFSTSFAIVDDIILCDPTLEEENISQSTFTITIDGLNGEICSVDKVGGTSISLDMLSECIDNATQRSKDLAQSLFQNLS